jgi:glutathione S-transferase
MKLYDSVGPNPRIVRMFMAEKGIEMPKQTVDLRKGENREADHLKRNPHGQMPTLELDDGHYLSEITAICEYLEEKNPKPAMIGSTPEERAECRMWTRRVDLNIAEPLANGYRFGEALKFFENRILCAPEASPGLKMIAANRLQWLNGQMAGKDYVCDGGWQGISVRQALHAGGHPALLLARFRWPGRPATGCRQHQHCGMDGARCGTAVGEGVILISCPGRGAARNAALHPGTAVCVSVGLSTSLRAKRSNSFFLCME